MPRLCSFLEDEEVLWPQSPSVKWGEIIGPVGTRLCETPGKAPGRKSSLSVPVFPVAKARGQLTPQGVSGGAGEAAPARGGEAARQGLQDGRSHGERSAGSPGGGQHGASRRRWLASGSALSLRHSESHTRQQKEPSAPPCREEVNSEKS